jgi:quaternary ammonium compound-resistance protein SugE
MTTMIMGVSLRTILMIMFVTGTQVAGSALLVKTDGFRASGWTALCLGIYVASFYVMANMFREGMPLGLLLPLLAAMVPLLAIIVGYFMLGETASMTRIGLLVGSCVLVGLAARS